MSSAGVTLQGSFSGETGTIDEVGFYYGSSTGNLPNKVVASGTSSPFSKAISGLSAGEEYYYKAYVHEYNESTSAYEYRYGSEESFTTKKIATATVTTVAASPVGATTATLNGSFSGASGTISDRGFRYRVSGTGNWTTVGLNSTEGTSGSFSYALSNLDEGETYQFQAYVTELNEDTGNYEDRWAGNTLTFTTSESSSVSSNGYLGCYEIPSITNLSGTGDSGTKADRGDKWYRYNTTNSKQQVATHTFEHPTSGSRIRNYTILYDETHYAPLWCAHAMHASMWPKNDIDRGNWTTDPAISLTQQSGLDSPYSSSISRGHFVAAQYRKCSNDSMDQTFYYSNQAPQNQSFNGGLWAQLEGKIVTAAPSNSDTLYVVTGVLYDSSWYAEDPDNRPTTYPSGNLNVPYPSHFYVCIMKCSFSSPGVMSGAVGCAYLCTNEPKSSNKASDLPNYQYKIKDIETLTGFNFFANVPAAYQTQAENTITSLW